MSTVDPGIRRVRAARAALIAVFESAMGRIHRDDPALPRTGGPAGNARLTAAVGLLLLGVCLAELVTLLDVNGLISWHIGIGVALIPLALAKTATTGWRILRYYGGVRPYRQAGPPPMPLRILGPVVVVTTLAVLGSGLALIAVGPDSGRATLFTAPGLRVSPLTIHQAAFILWAVATGLHVLARAVPAVQLLLPATSSRPTVSGSVGRVVVVVAILALAAMTAAIVLSLSGSWTSGDRLHRPDHLHATERVPVAVRSGSTRDAEPRSYKGFRH
jgi:hypothetical protein